VSDNVTKVCVACARLVVTNAQQTPICAKCRSLGLAGADELAAVKAQLEVATKAAQAYYTELVQLEIFDCPACQAVINTRTGDLRHYKGCAIAQILNLETMELDD